MSDNQGASADADRAAGLRPQPATPSSQSSIPSAGCDPIRLPPEESARLRRLGSAIAHLRLPDESIVVLSVGARCPDYDCPDGSVEATVRKGGETATAAANGNDLATALLLARGKVNDQIAAKQKRRDRDASLAEDAKRLSPEGVAARADEGGIAQGEVA